MISACEWIFGGRPLADVAGLLAEAGYDAVEVNGDPGRRDLDGDLPVSVSGTTAICNWPTDERDLAHPDAAARRRAVDYYRGCVDLAVEVGAPVVGLIPAAVGRLDALTSYERELAWAAEGVREVGHYAGERDVQVGIEAINRYETHLVNRIEQALELAEEARVPSVGVIADAFHMQLEEADSAAAVRSAGSSLLALHVADSNRLGLGHGQLELDPVLAAAREIGFAGPVVLECTAPGPNPFQPDKGPARMPLLERYVRESGEALRHAGL